MTKQNRTGYYDISINSSDIVWAIIITFFFVACARREDYKHEKEMYLLEHEQIEAPLDTE